MFLASHMLGELRDRESMVLQQPKGGQGSKAHHEQVQATERDEVRSQLTDVRVQLAWEPQAARDARHCGRYQI